MLHWVQPATYYWLPRFHFTTAVFLTAYFWEQNADLNICRRMLNSAVQQHNKGLILTPDGFQISILRIPQRQAKSCHRAQDSKPLTCAGGSSGRKVTTRKNSSTQQSRRRDYRLSCSQILANQGLLLADCPSPLPGCPWCSFILLAWPFYKQT